MNCTNLNEVVFTGEFEKGLKNWTTLSTASYGQWSTEDNELVYHTLPSQGHFTGFLSTNCRFQEITSAHAEFRTFDVRCETDLWFRTFNQTMVIRILHDDKENTLSLIRMIGNKFTPFLPVAPTVNLNDYKAAPLPNEWNSLDYKASNGQVTVVLNGVTVLSVEDAGSCKPTQMFLKTNCNGARFRNVLITAKAILPFRDPAKSTAKTGSSENSTASETVHTANLSADLKAGRVKPFGFLEHPASCNWTLSSRSEEAVYKTERADTLCETWLHGFDKDGEITAEVICDNPASDAVCGMTARFAVEGSFLRAGYDFGRKAWLIWASAGVCFATQEFVSQTALPMQPGEYYTLRLTFHDDRAELFVNGQSVVTAENLQNMMYGRMGAFAQKTGFCIRQFSCCMTNGGKITDGVLEQTVDPTKGGSHFEIERIDDDTLVGIFHHAYISYDQGLHFEPAPGEYDGTCTEDSYCSILKRKDGVFLQLLCTKDFLIRASADMKNWTDVCHVLPKERIYDEQGRFLALVHVSSFTELPMPDGSLRIFLPIGFRKYDGASIVGHYTCIFYSDDGGTTWCESKNDVRSLPELQPWGGTMSWCESKVIRCADGRLRMFCCRKIAPCMHYADSFDNGETWTAYGELPDMPCATSSFGICEDPLHSGTYYMVYVKNQPYFFATIFPRTNLVLAKTENGIDWTEIMEIDRFGTPDFGVSAELYQLLDPSITICEDYIFIGYGRSDDLASPNHTHNAQRIRFVRIDRKKAGI